MSAGYEDEFVAECLWPGVTEAAVHDLEERVRRHCAGPGCSVQYRGAVLMPTDEVVLFVFKVSEEEVRQAAEAAGVPFDRLLAARTSSNPKVVSDATERNDASARPSASTAAPACSRAPTSARSSSPSLANRLTGSPSPTAASGNGSTPKNA